MGDELKVVKDTAVIEGPAPVRELTKIDETWRMATALSRADFMPADFTGKPANCFLALELAERMGASVLEVAQNLYLVHGNPGWKASYLIGQANKHGPFRGGLQFTTTEMSGEMAVECWAIHRETGERMSKAMSMETARLNGWTTRKGNLYGKLPELMLSYRAATHFIRLHCPQVMFGMHTVDELEDIGPRAVEVEVSETMSNLQQSLLEAEEEPTTEGGEG